MKRTFDLFFAVPVLLLLSPLFVLIALFIKIDSRGPVLFRQERIGRGYRPFAIYKFRTMVLGAERKGGQITPSDDHRITLVGRVLRKLKLDELPQLLNVVKGDMSLVGPRPEVRRYVERFRDDYDEILRVRPGITDLASIKYRNEAEILGQTEDPEAVYATQVLPEKIRLAKEYIRQSSVSFDLILITKTALRLLHWRS